jgi:hypothetical protein
MFARQASLVCAALMVCGGVVHAFPGPRNDTRSVKSALPANATLSGISSSTSAAAALALPVSNATSTAALVDPPGRDAVLDWNGILLNVNAIDHSGIYGDPDQGGPGKTARAFAMVHIAIYDAVNSIKPRARKYLVFSPSPGASIDAAVAQAAHDTLVVLYPKQAATIDAALNSYLATLAKSSAKQAGIALGAKCAAACIADRAGDGSDIDPGYTPGMLPGDHRVDPLNPGQGFLGSTWGSVKPFALLAGNQFRAPPPPDLDSPEYAAAFNEVKTLGGDGIGTPTMRSQDQLEIGLFWGYDGTRGLGTPPRLYNQIVRQLSQHMGTNEVENARLFALVNIAQAEAGICCWESKYFYNFWRPILGIRESDPGTGPSGLGDGNAATAGDTSWTPYGAPASNSSNGGVNFTPPFPAYPSGHATFGGSLFRMLARYYGTSQIPFTFTSDELNGQTRDNNGVVRPLSPRSYDNLEEADAENAQSRIYLGIHWQFDAMEGMNAGHLIADWVYDNCLQLPVLRR